MINPSFKEYLPSYYVSTANPHPSYPTLEGRLKTETCVIGGGLSGLCTALPLAENGHEVIVLEAARIGFGASAEAADKSSATLPAAWKKSKNKSVWNRPNGSGSNLCKPLNWLTRAFKNTTSNAIATRIRYRRRTSSALGRIATMARTRPKTLWCKPLPALG